MSLDIRGKALKDMTTKELNNYVEALKKEKSRRINENQEALNRIMMLDEIRLLEKELGVEVVLAG